MKPETSGAVLELLLAEAAPNGGSHPEQSGVVVGTLSGFDEAGQPWVALPDPESGRDLPARSIVILDQGHLGSRVLLAFERNDRRKPIVIGVMQESGSAKPTAPDQKLAGSGSGRGWRNPGAQRQTRDRTPLWKVQYYAHPCREGVDSGCIFAQPLFRSKSNQGRLGPDQLKRAGWMQCNSSTRRKCRRVTRWACNPMAGSCLL